MPDPEPGWDASALASSLCRRRAAGERIALVFGSFDILHPGHVDYLRRAARCGDLLVVALHDDDAVSRRGGEGRPLNPLADRIEVLGAIRWVDYTVGCSDEGVADLIEVLAPAVVVRLAEAGDSEDPIANAAMAAGVAITTLRRLAGHAGEAIVARVRAIPLGGQAGRPAE